jgi:hypothetical protein
MADWNLAPEQQANLGMGANPFLGSGGSPYLQSMIDQASADVTKNYNQTTQPAFNAAMAKSGSFGNEGVAQMNASAQSDLQKNLGNLSNTMRSQDYGNQQNMYQWQQGLLNNQNQFNQNFGEGQRQYNQNFGEGQRQFNLGFGRGISNDAYSQNMNNLTTGVGLLGTMAGYNANDLTSANRQQNTPLDYFGQFNQQANSLGQGYGTTTGTTGSSSSPLMSAIGGAQLGNSAMSWWNQQNPQNQSQPISQTNQNAFDSWGSANNWFGTGTSA